jgi:cation diffusion facilitator CzcD-associated flavoprotein CzcO
VNTTHTNGHRGDRGTNGTAHRTAHTDVLIVGAGISGVAAGYHLQTECPNKSYAILEGRERMGGTWDLFRYPGIRSDSDMYTLGFSFRPWTNTKAIADGGTILSYVRDTAAAYGIDKKIVYRQKVERASWSSKDARWTIEGRDAGTGETFKRTCNFLFMCAGYYDYDRGYTPDFPGQEAYRGRLVHPQFWTPDVEYAGKRVVVIGSGATAVTLVPELAKKAAHVTMLQRSPTYIVSVPARDPVADLLRGKVSESTAASITRWKNVAMGMAIFQACRRFPDQAKRLLVNQVRKATNGSVDVETHFTPKYNPWDQRMCLIPDGDLFKSINEGRSSVVTGAIDRFTEKGIRLSSGQELEADLVVTATGLKLKFLGGLALTVDGERVQPSKTMAYKGMMCSGVPNMALAIGYTNASWTLKCDLTAEYVCRLLNHMDDRGFTRCVPVRDPGLKEAPLIDFSSGYVRRAIADFPTQGPFAPWRVYQNYALDRVMLKRGRLNDGAMEFSTPDRAS